MILLLLTQVYSVAGGEVSWWTVVRSAAGLVPHEIQAINRDVSGTVRVTDTAVVGTLYAPVARFTSGNLQRDQDVAEILEYRRYPFIVVAIQATAGALQPVLTRGQDSVKVSLQISLTVRDCTRVFPNLPASLVRRGDTLVGHVMLSTRFTELGLSPPRVKGLGFLGGLISRADDTLLLTGSLRFVNAEIQP